MHGAALNRHEQRGGIRNDRCAGLDPDFHIRAGIIMQRYREYRFASRLHRCFGVPAAVLVRKAAGQLSTEGRGRKN